MIEACAAAKDSPSIVNMCRWLGVSRSGYYDWKARDVDAVQGRDASLRAAIRAIHERSRGTYGWRRIWIELEREGTRIGRDRLQRLMRAMGLQGVQKPRFRRTTDSNHDHPIAPDLLKREFEVSEPNQAWVSDISYVWTREGWLYLAVILDLFSRRVVGFSIREHMRTELNLEALAAARGRRGATPGLIFHSDRGTQYASRDHRHALAGLGMRASMSRKGDCWDNAVAESFFGTLKRELIHRRRWDTREEARRAIYEYIEVFYNRQRTHSTLGYLSPAEYERRHESSAA